MRSITFAFLLVLSLCASVLSAQEFGYASYYSDEYHGSETAYGELYDRNKMTAAHKMHPLGTRLRVTRLDTKKSVIVRVNDRGPYLKGRIVELSYVAAKQLGMLSDGPVEVKVEVLGQEVAQKEEPKTAPIAVPTVNTEEAAKPTTTAINTPPPPVETKPAPAIVAEKKVEVVATPVKPNTKLQVDKNKLVRGDLGTSGLFKIAIAHSDKKGFGVQVASVSSYESMMEKVAELQGKWFDNILISMDGGKKFRVILGPFDTEGSAKAYDNNLKKKRIDGFVVNLAELK
ncbi:MAG: septal ring lytic transglycosylase RlpA family protein [Haliscomenobacter sp.]|uniref:septal ring lytic transglycosylase RlpA family protein n=1 Tax=Haliscomenobacter sp. TaxID=2717303 RepID=UPI0029BD93AF|nr:septal ring lytic transglycosylase RlpA family protein [Haliscomenobacter sp.]MDX2071728.1 septal ring lytic transglycosylase RlpA family protein [Haliscomenobacter sp.]